MKAEICILKSRLIIRQNLLVLFTGTLVPLRMYMIYNKVRMPCPQKRQIYRLN